MVHEVTLDEMLTAREERTRKQEQMIAEFGTPVISFTMNIAGPVKDTAMIRRAFSFGCSELRAALKNKGFVSLREETVLCPTGCEALIAVRAEAEELKAICVTIEESTKLGRLFDMDVLDRDGRKLERGKERCCIVCGAAGRGCASRRLHTVPELQVATRRIIETHFMVRDSQEIVERVTNALVEEVRTTPKPGLVDLNNNGSHRDMTVSTFLDSAEALIPYWRMCFKIGVESAQEPAEETFRGLQRAGVSAEKSMLAATGGVNTHKGAIYLLGVICGAIGRLWPEQKSFRNMDAILQESAAMVHADTERVFTRLLENPESADSAGEKLFAQYGFRGVRGELADGLPGIACFSMPLFRRMLSAGTGRNEAGVMALLSLIARGTDTNMAARGGIKEAEEAANAVKALLEREAPPSMQEVERLDRQFISRNLSPGGCADLLAATYFLYDWCF